MKISEDEMKKVELIYFRSYIDFSYSLGGNFSVKINKNKNGFSEFWVSDGDNSRLVLIIQQTPVTVFCNISPDKLISVISSMLLKNYCNGNCIVFDSIEELLINLLSK